MYEFLGILWFIFSLVSIVSFIRWLVKRKNGKLALFSFIIALACFIGAGAISTGEIKTGETNENKSISEGENDVEMIIDATQFALLSEEELIKLLGEPESRENWNWTNPRQEKYEAVTLTYDEGNQEFMLIDGKVVRFTYYGKGEKYEDDEHALRMFGINPKDMVQIGDTGFAIKYRKNNRDCKVDEFWLIEDSGPSPEANIIGTVKITYDSSYF